MKSILSALALSLAIHSAYAANWAHWRGPELNGSSPEKNLPSEFSKTKNVQWTATLPGPSAATPVIWEDRVFVNSGDARTKTLHALCVDRKNGKVLWNQE